MLLTYELNLDNFEAWSGAKDTLARVQEHGQIKKLEVLVNELHPEGMTEGQLNDFLWFDRKYIYNSLGIKTEDELNEEIEELEEQIEELEEEKEEYKTALSEETDEDERDDLQAEVDYIQEQIEELQDQIEELREEF